MNEKFDKLILIQENCWGDAEQVIIISFDFK